MRDMVHKNISVRGRVQGVGFRFSAREQARQLSIKGHVKNKADGTVYIEAEGEPEKVNQYVRWCKQGPPHAQVEDIEVEEGEMKNYSAFGVGH